MQGLAETLRPRRRTPAARAGRLPNPQPGPRSLPAFRAGSLGDEPWEDLGLALSRRRRSAPCRPTPASTAACASAVRSSGKWCSGSPASSPTRTAPSSTAAETSSTARRFQSCGRGVDQHELPAGVGHHQRADRQRQRRAAVVGVDRDRAVQPDHPGVDLRVGRGGHLDDRVDAVRERSCAPPPRRPAAGSRSRGRRRPGPPGSPSRGCSPW